MSDASCCTHKPHIFKWLYQKKKVYFLGRVQSRYSGSVVTFPPCDDSEAQAPSGSRKRVGDCTEGTPPSPPCSVGEDQSAALGSVSSWEQASLSKACHRVPQRSPCTPQAPCKKRGSMQGGRWGLGTVPKSPGATRRGGRIDPIEMSPRDQTRPVIPASGLISATACLDRTDEILEKALLCPMGGKCMTRQLPLGLSGGHGAGERSVQHRIP